MHLLSGARLTTLLRLLARHGGCSRRHVGQVALLLATAAIHAPFGAIESLRVARRVREARFDPPPVLIVGHWRSGTTYLHNLMSRDPQFCFPTLGDAVRPHEFFPGVSEWLSRRLLAMSLPPVRPMDDVPLRLDLPQEDELALASMGAPSFFNCFYFPRHLPEIFRREVLFEGLDEPALRKWRHDLVYYLAKLSVLHSGRRLLLKNPAHSARLTEVTALYPSMKIIHIHRDPIEVFTSMRRLFQGMWSMVALQEYDADAIDAHILSSYPLVMDRLCDGLDRLAPGTHVTVRYADLVDQPVETLERIYQDLDLKSFAAARAGIARFADENRISPRPAARLDPALMQQINERWQVQIARLGYDVPRDAGGSNRA